MTRALTVTYGARYGHYDYLNGENLLSPRAGVVFTPAAHVRLNALVSIRALAPGAEEFMAPTDMGIWLPPQRTFSSVIDGNPLIAERTRHVEAGVERDITARTTISVRAFSQHVDNQLMTLFGVEEPGRPPAIAGHYFVANSGPLDASGYAAGMRTVIANRVRGSIEYSFARAERNPSDGLCVFRPVRASRSPFTNEFTTSRRRLETDVPETSTHVACSVASATGLHRARGGADPGLIPASTSGGGRRCRSWTSARPSGGCSSPFAISSTTRRAMARSTTNCW